MLEHIERRNQNRPLKENKKNKEVKTNNKKRSVLD